MASAAIGRYFGVEMWDIKEAIEQYVPNNNRSQYKETGRNALLLDCYNANPSSMKVALHSFEAMAGKNKVAMLGGMRELGEESQREHEAIVERLLSNPTMHAVLVGPEYAFADGKPNIRWFPDVDAAVAYFAEHPLNGATVLLKGSNSTRMWKLEEVL